MNMKNLIKSVLVVAVIAGVFLKTGDVFGVCSAVLRYGSECTCTGWMDGWRYRRIYYLYESAIL